MRTLSRHTQAGNGRAIFVRPLMLLSLGTLLGSISPSPCLATTLNVPSDYATIQTAVDAAADGDSVVVAPGNYVEGYIRIFGKRLFIVGAGRDATFLSSADYEGFVITYGSHVAMTGFDITSGGGTGSAPSLLVGNATLSLSFCRVHDSNGGGIAGGAIGTSPDANVTCSDVLFLNNTGVAGAVYIGGGNIAHFTRCRFENNFTNQSINTAGAAFVSARDAQFIDCDFIGNTSVAGYGGRVGGLHFFGELGGTLLVERCLFLRNQGTDYGAILFEFGGSSTVRHCTLAQNTAQLISAVGIEVLGPLPAAQIENCIVTANGPAPALGCVGGMPTVLCSDVWGNADDTVCPGGADNITADPQFCGTDRWDLQVDSPCAPASNPTCGLIGARAVGCGIDAAAETTWGQIKSMWLHR